MKINHRIALAFGSTLATAATLLALAPTPALAVLAPAPVLTVGPCSVSATWAGADDVQLNVGSSQIYVQGNTVQATYGPDYVVPAGQPVGVEVSAFINGSYATNYFTTITPACSTGSNVHVTKVVQGPVPVSGQYTIGLFAATNAVNCDFAIGSPVGRFDIPPAGGSVVVPVVPGQQYCVVELAGDGAISTTYTNQLFVAAPAGSVDATVTNSFNGIHLHEVETWLHNGVAVDPAGLIAFGSSAFHAHVYDAASNEVAARLCYTFAQQAALTCPSGDVSLPTGGRVVFTAQAAPAGWPLRDFTITDADCPGVANGATCVVTLTNTLDDPPVATDPGTTVPETTVPETTPATTPTTEPSTDQTTPDSGIVVDTVADPVATTATALVSPFVPSGDIRLPETGSGDRRVAIGAGVALLLGLALLRIRSTNRPTAVDDLL